MATQQKRIPEGLILLAAAVDFDGHLLDVYATFDEDGYQLAEITPHGYTFPLTELLPSSTIDYFDGWIERNHPLTSAMRRANSRRAYAEAYTRYFPQPVPV